MAYFLAHSSTAVVYFAYDEIARLLAMPFSEKQASDAWTGFVPPAGRIHSPRQGRDVRFCVVKRERFPRRLLWRVVRVRQEKGLLVTVGEGEGRSAYVSRDMKSVIESNRKNRMAKALRCSIPPGIFEELKRRAAEWDRLSSGEKGLLFCEVYGEDGVDTAIEEVQGTFSTEWNEAAA